MKIITFRLSCFFILMILAFTSHAQLATKVAEASFKKFDSNQSGWLSGKELDACNCKKYDMDGDNEVTLQEFFKGKGIKTADGNAAGEGKVAPAQPVNAHNRINGKNAGTATNKLPGAWWFTAILYANGEVYELSNRNSGLNLEKDGKYVLNSWLGGANNMRTVGNYTVAGNQLKLMPSGSRPVNYTITLTGDGTLMTMKSGDGSGYKATRSNN